jgi:hypothetical protein
MTTIGSVHTFAPILFFEMHYAVTASISKARYIAKAYVGEP